MEPIWFAFGFSMVWGTYVSFDGFMHEGWGGLGLTSLLVRQLGCGACEDGCLQVP